MLQGLYIDLKGVSAYRNILKLPVMEAAVKLLDHLANRQGEQALEEYTQLFYLLRYEGYSGLGDWMNDQLHFFETPFSTMLAQDGNDPELTKAARQDVETFSQLCGIRCEEILRQMGELLPPDYVPVLGRLPRWTEGAPFDFDSLTRDYKEFGAGIFARYQAFIWESGRLVPVAEPDSKGVESLVGFERQREEVIANTRALLAGKQVNNVLLYGDSGTGKSVTVKSLLAVPGFEQLRLIEVDKDDLAEIPELLRKLNKRRQKFILFIDDLAFDQDDKTYSNLKTILEGGLEKRPENVAVYATSNRRNLVRQTFSDRAGDEIDAGETIQEKTALADRFGLRIAYLSLSKAEFLELVAQLAAQSGIDLAPDTLRAEAIKWEMHHAGRTPRVARQFILSLKAQQG
jgi:predicted AAA+ superfamily ATPase